MLDRYIDGLKEASSRAKEMIQAKSEADKPKIFTDFIHALKTSAGSAHQLAHTQVDHSTKWLDVRDLLEKIIEAGEVMPLLSQKQNGHWLTIRQMLEQMVDRGKKLATSKAFKRYEILDDLELRKLRLSDSPT